MRKWIAIGLGVLIALWVALSAGCASGSKLQGKTDTAIHGQVKTAGSTTVLPLAQEAAVEFTDINRNANVEVQGGGSSAGITQLKERVIDVANSSRDLQPGENNGTLVDHKIAFDIIAVVVNPSNPVKNLTKEQAKAIFTGKITNWRDVGGPDEPIVVVIRDQASGTREVFDQRVLGSTSDKPVQCVASAIEQASNGVVREVVASTEAGIGYLSHGYVNKTVRPVNLDSAPPDIENASSGRYPLARYLHMFTRGQPVGAVKSYIDFVLSQKFQVEVVRRAGYIPIREVFKQ
ncbi:MAG TPA: phosphate ABC transporter substrate-binding protein [Candidatus Anoxymicrobiaceae bacterium]